MTVIEMKNVFMELLHYIIVFAVIAVTWLPLMNYFNNLTYTLLASLLIFFVTDQLAHRFMLGEKLIIE